MSRFRPDGHAPLLVLLLLLSIRVKAVPFGDALVLLRIKSAVPTGYARLEL
ncbi:hypothetical protein J2T12_001703 [Paenibacillus anaericanus]|uniref:hypothetical protein n=1 Tax=Paenibacillus anaericanus TaxID=170367 RepID=UPI00278906EB|nr:hypothetical protein [Paenibacillus anaericanus]MDQ0088297.1 hypothetical protein [Paenibacillus anaericanus]